VNRLQLEAGGILFRRWGRFWLGARVLWARAWGVAGWGVDGCTGGVDTGCSGGVLLGLYVLVCGGGLCW